MDIIVRSQCKISFVEPEREEFCSLHVGHVEKNIVLHVAFPKLGALNLVIPASKAKPTAKIIYDFLAHARDNEHRDLIIELSEDLLLGFIQEGQQPKMDAVSVSFVMDKDGHRIQIRNGDDLLVQFKLFTNQMIGLTAAINTLCGMIEEQQVEEEYNDVTSDIEQVIQGGHTRSEPRRGLPSLVPEGEMMTPHG